jgi:hypothetical protein
VSDLHVYVAGIELDTPGFSGGYCAVNYTAEGAEQEVLEWYSRVCKHVPESFEALDYDEDVASFYCWRMPVNGQPQGV